MSKFAYRIIKFRARLGEGDVLADKHLEACLIGRMISLVTVILV